MNPIVLLCLAEVIGHMDIIHSMVVIVNYSWYIKQGSITTLHGTAYLC